MSQLKHCLMATAGLVMLITAVAKLNAQRGWHFASRLRSCPL
jgi:hypothetical protein